MSAQVRKPKYISLLEASKISSYSQEYLSLRARQGKLRALKIGRNWVTTKSWLKEYIKITGKTPGVNDAELQQTPGVSAKFVAPPANLPVEDGELQRTIRVFREKIPIELPVAQVFKLTGALALVLLFTVGVHSLDLPTKGEKLVLETPNYVKNFSEGFDRSSRELALKAHFAVQELGSGFDTGFPTAIQQSNKQIQVFSEGFSYGLASPASVETFAKDYGEWLFKQTTSLPQGYVTLDQKVSEGIRNDVKTISGSYQTVNSAIAKGVQNNIQSVGEGIGKVGQSTKRGFFAFGNAVGSAVDRVVGGVRERFVKKPEPVAQEPEKETEFQKEEVAEERNSVSGPKTPEVVREVVRTERVLDAQELAILKSQVAGILTWRGDIDNLKKITDKIQSSPPQSFASNAPVYIGSSGVQVAGNVSASSIGATLAGAQNLGVGLSATIGETNNANSKLTVNAESFFNSPVKLTSSFNVGTSALNNLTIATSGNVETKGSIKILNSSDVAQVTLDTSGNVTITGALTAQGGSNISGGTTTLSALSVTGNTVLGDEAADTITFTANSLALTNSLNIDSNTLYIDASNNKVGLGTLTPARMLEILGAGPQLRISSDASNYTDLSHAAAGFFTINTTGSGIGLVDGVGIGSTYSTTTPPTDGLIVQGNVGIGTTSPSTKLDITGTLNATGASTLGSTLTVTGATTLSSTLAVTGESIFSSPARITVNDAITNAVTTLFTLDHNTTGTAAAGIGNRISFRIENASGVLNEVGRFDVSLTTATSASEDSTLAFTGTKA
ncbi:MAG: S-layer family protein, partial [Candidatus Wildermuthbacteria bacterium]|nr:S-layer family protein [Candidatus Wildermuthbacteria bacterium]